MTTTPNRKALEGEGEGGKGERVGEGEKGERGRWGKGEDGG